MTLSLNRAPPTIVHVQVGLVEVSRWGIHQVGASYRGLCQGLQLVAGLADEREMLKNFRYAATLCTSFPRISGNLVKYQRRSEFVDGNE